MKPEENKSNTLEDKIVLAREERARKKQQKEVEKLDFYKEVGEVIHKYRILRNMSQQTLAIKLGTYKSEIYVFETGTRPIPLHTLYKICSILKIDFRFNNRFSLEENEYEIVQAFRKRDYKYILSLLAQEI